MIPEYWPGPGEIRLADLRSTTRKVLDCILSRPEGVTDDEVAKLTGLSPHQTRHTRRKLERLRAVKSIGTKKKPGSRQPANLWASTGSMYDSMQEI